MPMQGILAQELSRTCFRPGDGQPQARSRELPETAFTPSSFSGSFDSALETVREASTLPGAPLKMTGAGGFASPQQHRMFGASLVSFAVDRAALHVLPRLLWHRRPPRCFLHLQQTTDPPRPSQLSK